MVRGRSVSWSGDSLCFGSWFDDRSLRLPGFLGNVPEKDIKPVEWCINYLFLLRRLQKSEFAKWLIRLGLMHVQRNRYLETYPRSAPPSVPLETWILTGPAEPVRGNGSVELDPDPNPHPLKLGPIPISRCFCEGF